MSTTPQKLAFSVGLLCAVIAAAMPMFYTPQFRQVFESFGAELPALTKLFVHYNQVFWLLPVLVIAAWFFWPMSHRRATAACLIGIISMVLVIPATVAAMYLPVFASGAAS